MLRTSTEHSRVFQGESEGFSRRLGGFFKGNSMVFQGEYGGTEEFHQLIEMVTLGGKTKLNRYLMRKTSPFNSPA